MVSPQSSTTANPPPLSYADRAKKAQNIKSKTLPSSQRIVSQNVAKPAASPVAPSTSSAGSSTVASTSASNPSPSHASISINVTPASSAALSARTTSGPPSPMLSPTPQHPNGDVKRTGTHSSGPHTVSVPKPTPAPPVNVWNLRKEQMAQTRLLSQSRPAPSSSSQKPPQSGSQDAVLSPPIARRPSDAPSDTIPAPSNSTALQNVTNHRSHSTMGSGPLVNGHNAHTNNGDDPFVVRPRVAQQSPVVSTPSVDDAESWPEVGRPAQGDSGQAESKDKEEAQLNGQSHDAEGSQSTSRKSEKTKWVQIPPEELQAAADALQPNRGHSRMRPPHPRHQGFTPVSGSASASGSTSGQMSQGQSRTNSSAGKRQTASHASSVSHSQVQSLTGSVPSSPHQPFSRKRLPEDGASMGAAGYGTSTASRSIRSSRSGSPQPYPTPPSEFVPRAGATAFQPASVVALPEQLHQDFSNGVTYYSAPIGLHPNPQPYHSPHASSSPARAPYTLPPNVYPAQQGATALPVHVPYAASAPYPIYPPYAYSYPPPYMYWPGVVPPVLPSSHSHSPVPMVPTLREGVPPPTLIARPPPPRESDAVAGYRDVGFVLPPAADYRRSDDREGVEQERGRRARELSFGSIGQEASNGSSPALHSVVGGSLGLDVGAVGEAVSSREEGEKLFPTFSIGITPGEPGPARIRSRTRTHSKGSTKLGDVTPAISTSEQSEPAAQAREVEEHGDTTEGEMKVIDLTDSETKWEFGTTKHPAENAAEAEIGRAAIQPSPEVLTNALGMSPGPPAGASVDEHVAPHPSTSHQSASMHNGHVPPMMIPLTGPISAAPNGATSAVSPSVPRSAAPLSASSAGVSDEWEVKDYGFGFGRMSGTGYHAVAREERILRERDREREQFQARDQGREYYGRPRRGSYGSGYPYERGAFPGRRGRGMNGGFGGRGFHAGRFARGEGAYQTQRQPPFAVAQSSTSPGELNGYYPPASVPAAAPAALATYIPPAYENYSFPTYPTTQHMQAAPPLPMPLSPIPFPLDSTRYYLLGQLEYYLSPQNMAKDYFLRSKMDAQGWISISLIASFNRVKHLTMDLQLVKDVLTLSSLVEVREDWVRMRQWEQFVLPYAPKSALEGGSPSDLYQPVEEGEPAVDDSGEAESCHEECEGDEEDEEDVVFVLDRDGSRSWSPERRLG
ncbi:hypothetical protein B0H21DRAFT_199855 [Amylocystis lapponica]|nr:hypothetical protein B0H21DRAFT_199855 [Amylocystis lapponica]